MEEKTFEIKQVGDREIGVGENRFYFDEDDIIHVELIGDYDVQEALLLRDAYLELLNMVKGKVNTFIDNSRTGKHSQEARKILSEMIKNEQRGKIAVLGLNPVARMIASLILGSSKKKDTHIFKTKEEALAWLKE